MTAYLFSHDAPPPPPPPAPTDEPAEPSATGERICPAHGVRYLDIVSIERPEYRKVRRRWQWRVRVQKCTCIGPCPLNIQRTHEGESRLRWWAEVRAELTRLRLLNQALHEIEERTTPWRQPNSTRS